MAHFSMPLPIEKFSEHIASSRFYSTIGHILRGTNDQLVHVMRHMASTHKMKELTGKELYSVSANPLQNRSAEYCIDFSMYESEYSIVIS